MTTLEKTWPVSKFCFWCNIMLSYDSFYSCIHSCQMSGHTKLLSLLLFVFYPFYWGFISDQLLNDVWSSVGYFVEMWFRRLQCDHQFAISVQCSTEFSIFTDFLGVFLDLSFSNGFSFLIYDSPFLDVLSAYFYL